MSQDRLRHSVDAYVAAWNEHDPGARARLLEIACADDFRLLTAGRAVHGRAGLDALIADFQKRRPGDRARLTSEVEIGTSTFRYVGVVETVDGERPENLDAGEYDEAGRMRLVLTFVGACVP